MSPGGRFPGGDRDIGGAGCSGRGGPQEEWHPLWLLDRPGEQEHGNGSQEKSRVSLIGRLTSQITMVVISIVVPSGWAGGEGDIRKEIGMTGIVPDQSQEAFSMALYVR